MAPHRWANEEQLLFLRSELNEFLEKQKEKKLALFWPALHHEWFSRWPVEPNNPDTPVPVDKEELDSYQEEERALITKQKDRLKSWFNNNKAGKQSRNGGKRFQIQMKPQRRPQHLEIYSRQYYIDRVRDKVKAEIKDKGLTQKQVLSTIKRLTTEAFEAESTELKEAIYAEAAAGKLARSDDSRTEEVNTPESYAAAITALPNVLDDFFQELALRTGWIFTVLAGGPEPINGGKIRTLGYDCGKNDVGLSFGTAHPSFQATFLKPFAGFVKQVFPSNVCASRAIVIKSDGVDDPPTTAADMAALTGTIDMETVSGTPQCSISLAPSISASPSQASPDERPSLDPLYSVFLPERPVPPIPPVPERPIPPIPQHSTAASTSSPDPPREHVIDPLSRSALNHGNSAPSTHVASTSPDPPADDVIDPLLRSVFNPADGASSIHGRTGTHPSLPHLHAGDVTQLPFEHLLAPVDRQFAPLAFMHPSSIPPLENQQTPAPPLLSNSPVVGAPSGPPAANPADGQFSTHLENSPSPFVRPLGVPSLESQQPLAPTPPSNQARSPSSVAPLSLAAPSNNGKPGTAQSTTSSKTTVPRKRALKQTALPTGESTGEGGRGQRLRKAPATKEIVPLTDSSRKAPEWLRLAHEFVADKTAGPSWDRCITAWFAFEGTFSADEVMASRLPESKNRPAALSVWLLTRNYSHPPEILDPTSFGLEWLVWWNALQPAWRKARTHGTLPVTLDPERPSSHSLRSLRKGGPNGLVTVLIGLKCWRLAGGDGDLWMRAVSDLTSCFVDVGAPIAGKSSDSRVAKKRKL